MSTMDIDLHALLLQKVQQDELVLPTLPEIALQIRDAVDRSDVGLAELTQVVSRDPGLSARLIKVANSALYKRAIPVDSLAAAMSRIGLARLKEIATTLALEQLFQSHHSLIDRYLRATWQRSADVAAVASALVDRYLQEVNPHAPFRVDKAGMVGLLYNVGRLPILVEVESLGEDYIHGELLKDVMIRLQTKVGLAVLRAWQFDRDYQEGTAHLNFPLKAGDPLRYVHFLQGALLYSLLENGRTLSPRQNERKLLLQQLNVLQDDEDLLGLEFAGQVAAVRESFL